MSGIYIPGDKVPTKCVGCGFRDPEYGGNCILMPLFDVETYEEQFERCPFKELQKQFGSVSPHGRLIDAEALLGSIKEAKKKQPEISDVYDEDYFAVAEWVAYAPTIIPADHIGDANEMVADVEVEG